MNRCQCIGTWTAGCPLHDPDLLRYSPMNRAELRDLESRYGRELSEREALYLLRRERERSMREELFQPTSSHQGEEQGRDGRQMRDSYSAYSTLGEDLASPSVPTLSAVPVQAGGEPECKSPQITADQIVYADDRWPAWVPLAIFVALFVGEAWLAAHFHVIDMMKGWFK